jgi:hypothetical protein
MGALKTIGGTMKRVSVFLLCFLAMQSAFADDTNLTLTVDGVTYSNVTFGTVTPSSVSFRHSTGATTVPLAKLPPDLRQRLGYDPQKAAAFIQERADVEAAAAKLAGERLAEEQKRAAERQAAQQQNEKAIRERDAAQRAHEEELNNLRNQLAGTAQQFIGQVTDVFAEGLLVSGGVPDWGDQPALLVGHPRERLAAEGDRFICMASRSGVYEYKLAFGGKRTVARWIYISKLGDGNADYIGRSGTSR